MSSQSGYVDLQINGCFGVDFNSPDMSDQDLVYACQQLRNEGAAGILATVITANLPEMIRRVQRIQEIRERHSLVREMIWGLHVEGPFISPLPGFVGAHPPEFVRSANLDEMQQILDAGKGLVRIVTLAPERDDNFRVTKMLAAQEIVVSAGHCDPSLDQLKGAIDAGLAMFTHLGNGCPRQLDRHDNVIQRVLSVADRLWCCLIADGMHLPWFVLKNFLRSIGSARTIIVSDAISGAGMGSGTYSLGGASVDVSTRGETQWSGASGYFAGSTTTLAAAARKMRQSLGLSESEAHLLMAHNPRQLLGEAA